MRIVAVATLLVAAGFPFLGRAATHHRPAYNHSIDTDRMVLSRMAPADEYFGRMKESILEIRNRLNDLDGLTGGEISGRMSELRDLRDAILDWKHKYPLDPWLPRMLERLHVDFERALGG
jgi:hypothetical protein